MAVTAVPILAGPACPHCKGGRSINGVPCEDCDGSGRQPARRRMRLRLPRWLAVAADAAAVPAGLAVRGLPGIGGAVVFTAGSAMIVHGVFHQVPLLGVAALVAGVFGLLADRQLLWTIWTAQRPAAATRPTSASLTPPARFRPAASTWR